MVELRFSPLRLRLFNWHKWLGIAILALSLARLRLAPRRRLGCVPLPPGMPAWQLAAARGTHFAFYVLFLVVPLSGWLVHLRRGRSRGLARLAAAAGPHAPATSRSEKTC